MVYLLEYACTSNIGKCRMNNEDNFTCMGTYLESDNTGTQELLSSKTDTSVFRLFGVFDGMGGEYHGEIASYLASKRAASFKECSDNPIEDLINLCKDANEDICKYASENEIPSMGTTAAILLFDKKRIYLCNIGDSRIYRYSEDGLEQISEDHLGVAAFGIKPPLSQNLGIPEDELVIEPYTTSGYYNTGDKYLICSDGLTDMVTPEEVKTILHKNSPSKAASILTDEALKNGGKDNITVIVIEIQRSNGFWKNLFRK